MVLMAVGFMGYTLPWGQMGHWGVTVITSLLAGIPSLVAWILGGYHIHSSIAIYRYYMIHTILPVHVSGCLVFHVLYLHRTSTSSVCMHGNNNRIHLHTWLYYKDVCALVTGTGDTTIQCGCGGIVLAHVDNTLVASAVVTPLHILPEWYFLEYYAILKSTPSGTSGFLVMISYVWVYSVHGEVGSTGSLVECTGYTGRYFLESLVLAWDTGYCTVGVQLPVGGYMYYSRVLPCIPTYLYIDTSYQGSACPPVSPG